MSAQGRQLSRTMVSFRWVQALAGRTWDSVTAGPPEPEPQQLRRDDEHAASPGPVTHFP